MPSLTSSQKIFVAFGAMAVFFFAAWVLYKPLGMFGTKPADQDTDAPKITILEDGEPDTARWTEEYAGGATGTQFRATSTRPTVESGNLSKMLVRNMSDEFRSRFIDSTMTDDERQKLFTQLQDGTFDGAPDFSDYASAEKVGIVDSIAKKELHVLSDDSEAARSSFFVQYLHGIEPLQNESVNEFVNVFNDVVKNHDKTSADAMIARYRQVYDAVAKLSTPPSMQDLQARTLVFLKNALTIFVSLRNFDADPVRAYGALQHFQDLVGEWDAIAKQIKSLTQ